jgi:Ribbon-helix-helix protein, copG family
VYIYIVERTQIYLTRAESAALDREAVRTGRSRSQLIRDAIDRDYLGRQGGDLRMVLEETAGAWKGRRGSGAAYVRQIRQGRLARLHLP